MASGENSGDIFDHETSVLETSLALVDSNSAQLSSDDHRKLTKRSIKAPKA